MKVLYIVRVIGTQNYALSGCIELGLKKYARTFESKAEAYKFMYKYFRVNKNDSVIEELQA